MKKLILILTLISTSLFARERCEIREDLARVIMESRQSGLPMRDMISLAPNKDYINLIMKAYREPKWQSDMVRISAVNRFANDEYLACLSKEH